MSTDQPTAAAHPPIDLQSLLAPITPEQPTGANVHQREDPDRYNAVTRIQMRYFGTTKDWQERHTESRRRGQPRPVPNQNQSWQIVIDLATTCLTSESKDLWVAAYLVVALTYSRGFEGLNQGLRFLTALVNTYGSQLHPTDKPFAELQRSVPNLVDAVNIAPITDEAHGSLSRFDAVLASNISAWDTGQLEPYIALQTPMTDQVEHELAETPGKFYSQLDNVIGSCEQAFADLDRELRSQFPGRNDYPAYESVLAELVACRQTFARYTKASDKAAAVNNVEPVKGDSVDRAASSTNVVQERLNNLQRLEEIAAFFQRVEPLSPLPYLIRRAVTWGKMSLPEVLAELLTEEELIKLKERAGIPVHKRPEDPAT